MISSSIYLFLFNFLKVYLEQFCRSNADCKEIKYSECSENNKCICKSNYIAEFDHKVCKALLNEYCENVIDCSLFNSVCIDHKCRCLGSFSPQTNKECSIRTLTCFSVVKIIF